MSSLNLTLHLILKQAISYSPQTLEQLINHHTKTKSHYELIPNSNIQTKKGHGTLKS